MPSFTAISLECRGSTYTLLAASPLSSQQILDMFGWDEDVLDSTAESSFYTFFEQVFALQQPALT